VRLWEGRFEDTEGTWLRWCDREGNVNPTGTERAVRAEQELKQLKAKLQALGIELPP
jgi:hypothetical protein